MSTVTSFFPTVVGTLGFSRNITYALTAPPYLTTVVVLYFHGQHSDKKQERYWHVIAPLFISVLAFVIAVSTLNTGARYFAVSILDRNLKVKIFDGLTSFFFFFYFFR